MSKEGKSIDVTSKKYRGIGEAHPQSLVQVLLRLYKQTQKLVRIVFKVQKKARIYQTKSKQGKFITPRTNCARKLYR